MKLHLPHFLLTALLSCHLLSAAETINLNTYDWLNESSNLEDVHLTLSGDITAAYEAGQYLVWYGSTDEILTCTGNGTIDGQGGFIVLTREHLTSNTGGFIVESGITLLDTDIVCTDGAKLEFKGTIATSEDWFVYLSVYTSNAEDGLATLDLSNATIANNARVYLSFDGSGTFRVGTHTLNSRQLIEVWAPYYAGGSPSYVLDGNLVMADGGRIEYYPCVDAYGSGTITPATPLVVTGSVTITGATTLAFTLDNGEDGETYLPEDGTVLLTCASLKGDAAQLRIEQGAYVEESVESGDGYYYVTHSHVFSTVDDKVIKSMSYGDGYALYITSVGGIEPPVVPEEGATVNTSGTVTAPLTDKNIVELTGGTVDVSQLETLPTEYISGTSGELLTSSTQVLELSGTQSLGYSLAGAEGADSAAKLTVGSEGGAINSALVTLSGEHYDSAEVNVKSGLMEIATGTTVGLGSTATALTIGTEVAAGTEVTASVNNAGTINAELELLGNASMDNKGTIAGDVTLSAGSSLVNTDGSITGSISVSSGATLRNDGTISEGLVIVKDGAKIQGSGSYDGVQVLGGGHMRIGNSPGFTQVANLVLENGSLLTFTVDGTTPATADYAGEGTHSQLKVTDSVTLNGVATLNVEVTSGILAATTNDGKITITLVDAAGATLVDNSGAVEPLQCTITSGESFLKEGYEFVVDAATMQLRLEGELNTVTLGEHLEEDGQAIANTLWSSTSAVRSFARTAVSQLTMPTADLDTVTIWGSGLGDFVSMDDFTSNSGGYAVGIDKQLRYDLRLGVAFGQMFGTFTADNDLAEVEQESIMAGLYVEYVRDQGPEEDLRLTAYAAYGSVNNDAETRVGGDANLPGSAEWRDNVFAAGARAEWIYRVTEDTCIAPFIGLDYVYGAQEDFTETFNGGKREYREGSMQALSLPVGITIRTAVATGDESKLLPELTLAYVGDVVRKNPHVHSGVYGAESCHEGTKPGRNAFLLNVGSHWLLNESWSVGAFYNLEARSKDVSQEASFSIRHAF